MLKSEDIQVVSIFGKVKWLLLGSILTTSTLASILTALILQSMQQYDNQEFILREEKENELQGLYKPKVPFTPI